MAKACASGLPEGAQHAACRCYGAVAAGGLWLLLGGSAAAVHVAGRDCCRAAAELPALCAAWAFIFFAAARDVYAGVRAASTVLLLWIRKQCGHSSALVLCETHVLAPLDSIVVL